MAADPRGSERVFSGEAMDSERGPVLFEEIAVHLFLDVQEIVFSWFYEKFNMFCKVNLSRSNGAKLWLM